MKQRQKSRGRANRRPAVIFDFDGTIADSFEYVFNFLKAQARDTRDYTAAQKKDLRQMSMKRLALHLGVPVWQLPFTYFKGRRVMRAHMEHVKPFPGMPQVIKQLHSEDYQLFVASANSGKNIRHLLKQQDLLPYFKAVRGGSGYAGKSSFIRQMLVRYRLSKQTTWYVGDETSDVVAAAAAGVRCLAVTWGFADPERLKEMEADAYAVKPEDILQIVKD